MIFQKILMNFQLINNSVGHRSYLIFNMNLVKLKLRTKTNQLQSADMSENNNQRLVVNACHY